MAKSKKRPIEQYEHLDKRRKNNPPAGLVTPETDRDGEKKVYACDPHLDLQLVWAGKAERTSFEVPTLSLHVHERINLHAIIEAVERRNGDEIGALKSFQLSNPGQPLPYSAEAILDIRHRSELQAGRGVGCVSYYPSEHDLLTSYLRWSVAHGSG